MRCVGFLRGLAFAVTVASVVLPGAAAADDHLLTAAEQAAMGLANSYRFDPVLYGTWVRVGSVDSLDAAASPGLAPETLDWRERVTFFSAGKTSIGGDYLTDPGALGVHLSPGAAAGHLYRVDAELGYIVYRKVPGVGITGHGAPFAADPHLPGEWEEIDFVDQVGDFTPGVQSYSGGGRQPGRDRAGPLPPLVILEGGATERAWITWTAGLFSDRGGNNKVYAYHIERIGEDDFLFIEETSAVVAGRHRLSVWRRVP